jgi:uncharacterized cupin superfamily protein
MSPPGTPPVSNIRKVNFMSITFRPEELFNGKLDESPLAPPLAEVLGEEIPTRIAIPFTSDDSRILSGVWEAEPGLSRWEFLERGEAIYVLEGRMVVTEDNGEAITVEAGTSAIFPIGWQGTWEIQERIRKFFVIFTR